jgi:acyl transferase domain-containing protein/3-hydroxymyristoyl/3-hydroxydecanoyl-(acyl carrier protein) dehydratase
LDKTYSLIGAWLDQRPPLEELKDLDLPDSFDPSEGDDSLLYWLAAGKRALAKPVLDGHDPNQVGVIAGHVILPTKTQSEAAIALYGREATRSWPFNPFSEPPRTNPFRAVGYSARLLAKALGLKGPAYTVDAACASSLYAVNLALDRLFSGELTAVITGGLARADPLFTQLGFSQLRALSRSGVSRPFDQRADGLVVGSGACALVLKTLDRALADGDEILATILAVGLGNDRTGNLLAPDPEGQARVMRAAFNLAERTPESLGLIEAHGTSTLVGDKAEAAALKAFLKDHKLTQTPVLGSVKSNLGHLLSAAGAVALAKAVLALNHQVLPPSAGFSSPSFDLEAGPPLRILSQPIPWPEPPHGARLAAVNAFGFGGVNAQAVLEAYDPKLWLKPKGRKPKSVTPAPLEVDLIAARTVLAPWPSYDTLARFWLTPEEPPMAQSRRLGALKTTGFFFQELTLDVSPFKLPPKELAESLPQQTLVLKAGAAALEAAGLNPEKWPSELDRDRLGIFMGVEIDPRAADLALRWTAPIRAAEALIKADKLPLGEKDLFINALRAGGPPALTHSRVLGALGSFVASRLARYLGSGGPAFTMSEERDSGFRALTEAARRLVDGSLDLAVVGVVDTFGDPKTGYLAPRTVWVEGAAIMVLAGPKAAKFLSPLGRLKLNDSGARIGPLSGLFALNRYGFYLRHHLKPLGRGHGMAYWLKKPDENRVLTGPGYELAEASGREPQTLTVPPDPIRPDVWFYFKANETNPLAHGLARLSALLEANPSRDLNRLTRDFWALERDKPGDPALAIQARDGRELAALLKRALAGEEDRDLKPRLLRAPAEPFSGDLALVFPGSGNVYKGLGRGLALAFPAIMGQLEEEVSDPLAHFQSELFWTPNPKKPTCREAILAQVNFGLLGTRVLESLGLTPKAVLGYSLGETAALVALGIWPDRDELYNDLMASTLFSKDLTGELTAPRTYLSWPAKKPFKWLAGIIPRSEKAVAKALENLPPSFRFRVFQLIVNTLEEVVIGGEEQAVAALAQALEAPFFPVEDVAAVHSPATTPVKEAYYKFHLRRTVPRAGVKVYSSHWGKAYEPTAEAVAESLTLQAVKGHRFLDLINQAWADGARFFIEIGPGSSATRLVKAILADRPHLAASMAATAVDEGWAGVSQIISELWLHGQIPDPFKGQPQPTPEPDPRFLTPITLDPPALNWPAPPSEDARDPEVKTDPPNEDYLNWLQGQVKKDPKVQTPKTPSPKEDEPATASQLAEPAAKPEPAAKLEPAAPEVVLSREACLEFAVGKIGQVFGPEFSEVDAYPSRVRLPAEPLMLVDRVLVLEGTPKSLGPGRIVTEKDIRPSDWYLDDERITPGLAIESGQADLMLSGYLGADFNTKGLALYRLLDAEVVFLADPPGPGDTAQYDIKILRFFHHGETLMFRFDFTGSVNGSPLLTMREGRAGFFTNEALLSGRGLPNDTPKPAPVAPSESLAFVKPGPKSFSRAEITRLRLGDNKPLGRPYGSVATPLLPGGKLALFDLATKIERTGGLYNQGFIRVEAKVTPTAWYLVCHFPQDEVMPGTLMYDAALQALRLYLLTLGWLPLNPQAAFRPALGVKQSLKCRGQVTPKTSQVAYEVHVREITVNSSAEPQALAEAIMWADGKPIAEVRNLGLRLAGTTVSDLTHFWSPKSQKRKVSGSIKSDPEPPAAFRRVKPLSDLFFDKARLNVLIKGKMSEALGPKFARFDDGSFVARLPQEPYDFVDQAEVLQGQVGRVALGTTVEARYTPAPDSWLFKAAGGQNPVLPYAALNEVALQACGFLAAFMGTALLFDAPMRFRNLGGEATTYKDIVPTALEPLITKATLTKASILGRMTIQHYEFKTTQNGQTVYEGVTHFGFFDPENLARQKGLKTEPSLAKALDRPPNLTSIPYPLGPAWPQEKWRSIEELLLEAGDNRRIWAQSPVTPEAWFFQAHFPNDPVWPGSLGLEAFFQAAKYLAVKRYYPEDPLKYAGSFTAPLVGRKHGWLYRGQIPPSAKLMSLGLLVTKSDPHNQILTFNGLLNVDGLTVYQVDNFTVALRD